MGQSGSISCRTKVEVSSIEWRNQSSVLKSINGSNLTVLTYTFPMVTDDLSGQQYTCIAVTGNNVYRETVMLAVTCMSNTQSVVLFLHWFSENAVPGDRWLCHGHNKSQMNVTNSSVIIILVSNRLSSRESHSRRW